LIVRSRTVAPWRSVLARRTARFTPGLLLGSAAILGSLLVGSCLSGTESCEGSTTRVCTQLTDECTSTTGCEPIIPHCASICETYEQAGCKGGCVWKEGICRASCSWLTSESACVVEPTGCTWSGEQCMDTCAAVSSRESCTPGLCHWQSCTGMAPASCTSYSPQTCPISLGCDLNRHGGL
jgi:hypothetical protein